MSLCFKACFLELHMLHPLNKANTSQFLCCMRKVHIQGIVSYTTITLPTLEPFLCILLMTSAWGMHAVIFFHHMLMISFLFAFQPKRMDEKAETFFLLLRVKGKHLLEKRRHKLEHLEPTSTNFMECMLFTLRKVFLKVKEFSLER